MVDIPNTFIKSRLKHKKEIAIIKIRGVPVDIILVIPPYIYDPYVTIDCKGVKQLVVQCQNTIYGTMMASIMYYHNFRKSLELEGYKFNTY